MLFNILDINARYCLRGMVFLAFPAAAIAISLAPCSKYEPPVAKCNSDSQVLLAQAESYKDAHQFNLALPLFDRYIGLVANNPEAFADKAYCLNGQHKYNEALNIADRGLACDSDNVDALSNRSWALNHLGRYSEGLEAAQTALNLDPADAESWCDEGEALMGLGDYKSALVAFNKHCGMHENEWYGYDRRAACLDKLGMTDQAQQDRDKISSL